MLRWSPRFCCVLRLCGCDVTLMKWISSNTTKARSRMRSAPLYSIERRISAVMIRQGDSGWIDTSPDTGNTAPEKDASSEESAMSRRVAVWSVEWCE